MKMTAFERSIVEVTIEHEGGDSDHRFDSGGRTRHGVTHELLSTILKREATEADFQALTKEMAAEHFVRLYFRKPRLDMLPEAISGQIFDWSVNAGPSRAVKTLQAVLDEAGFAPGAIDGVVGRKTVAASERALEAMGSDWMNAAVAWERLEFLRGLIERKPSQATFRRGWWRRAKSFVDSDLQSLLAA